MTQKVSLVKWSIYPIGTPIHMANIVTGILAGHPYLNNYGGTVCLVLWDDDFCYRIVEEFATDLMLRY